ncbi:pyridoxamine 5'-phosphate oxidase family protein [Embleya sp. NPDC020630]|uniref:pyridoxamine 5'-phosphate oxidase family protein n=1 Tax=Embleya sp. NPDC020630 TaxID=3363979 RepID=UPI0037940467
MPIWYEYGPGGLVSVITCPGLRKVRLIEEAGRFALCAQVAEVDDYRYVSVGIGPTSRRERFDLAARYMGSDRAGDYIDATEDTPAGYIAIHMRPAWWHTFDFRVTPDGR